MEITFDPSKNERNLGFHEAVEFDFSTATYEAEFRKGEHRIVAVGHLKSRLHVLCFIPKQVGIRVISFRKANDREARKPGKRKTIVG